MWQNQYLFLIKLKWSVNDLIWSELCGVKLSHIKKVIPAKTNLSKKSKKSNLSSNLLVVDQRFVAIWRQHIIQTIMTETDDFFSVNIPGAPCNSLATAKPKIIVSAESSNSDVGVIKF